MAKRTSYNSILFTGSLYWAYTFLSLVILCIASCSSKEKLPNAPNRILIEAEISKFFYDDLRNIFDLKEDISLRYIPFKNNPLSIESEYVSGEVKDRKVAWIIYTHQSIRVTPPFGATIIMRPGDSLHINYVANQPVYSGNNTEGLALLDSLMLLSERSLKPRKKNSYNAGTLADFLEWNSYLDQQLSLQLPVVERYKPKISSIEYEYYKTQIIEKMEHNRVQAFSALTNSVLTGCSGINTSNLAQIWDSTQYKPSRKWLQSLASYYGSMGDIFVYLQMETLRKFNFKYRFDSLPAKEAFTYSLYTKAKKEYKGLMRERLMAYILDEPTLTEMGLKSLMTLSLLKDYYDQPGFPEYKQYVRKLEEKQKLTEKAKSDKKAKKSIW